MRIVLVTPDDCADTCAAVRRYPKLFQATNKVHMFDTPDPLKRGMVEQLLHQRNLYNLKRLRGSGREEVSQSIMLEIKTSMDNIVDPEPEPEPEPKKSDRFKAVSQAIMSVFESVRREEARLAPAGRIRWKNLQRIVESYCLMFPDKVATLDSKIKRLSSCLDFLGEIDKDSFEREQQIANLEKRIQTDKAVLEKLSKRSQRHEKNIERMSKKMRQYIHFSKAAKGFDELEPRVQTMLRHFCKVKKANYEIGLEEAKTAEERAEVIRGNRSKICHRLLKHVTFQSKIKNFWELRISWKMSQAINFAAIRERFSQLAAEPENPNKFMLSVVYKFCRFLEGCLAEESPDAEELQLDFNFILGFFAKYSAQSFVAKLRKVRFAELKDARIVPLTREVILFNHQVFLESIFGRDLAQLNMFVKRFLLYVDKEIKFVDKVLYKGQPDEAARLKKELSVGPEQSPMAESLHDLFREFFSQEDAAGYLDKFQENFIVKRRANFIEKELVEIDSHLRELLKKRRQSQSIGAKLSFEVQEWKTELEHCRQIREHLEGNCVMAISTIEFCPRFPRRVRERLKEHWRVELERLELPVSEGFDLGDFMLQPMQKERIRFKGLTAVEEHFEDITVLQDSELFCALVDPHGLAPDFLTRYFNDLDPVTLRVSAKGVALAVKKAVITGQLLILLKHAWEPVMPAVLRLLERDMHEDKEHEMIDLGDKVCKMHENFRCYMVVADEAALGGALAPLVKLVDLREFMEAQMEEHLVGVLRRREQVSNEELRKGLLFEKLEEKFQVDSLKNELLNKIVDHLRETQAEEEQDLQQKISELQEELINVAESLNITKLTIHERKKETDNILLDIDHRREEMLLLVREFKQVYLLHRGLQVEGKAHSLGVVEMFNVFFPIETATGDSDPWKRESEPPETTSKLKDKSDPAWASCERSQTGSRDRERLRRKLQQLVYSIESGSRRGFLLDCATRLSLVEERVPLEAFAVFMVVVKRVYLRNLEALKAITGRSKGKGFWRREEGEDPAKKAEELITVPNWQVHQLCEEMVFNARLVFNLTEDGPGLSGPKGLGRFFEAEWFRKKKSSANQKALGNVEADKLLLVDILETLSHGRWEGLFDKVKQNLIKEKNRGGIISRETRLTDLDIDVRGQAVPSFVKMLLLTIFNPERLCELADEFIELELGHVDLRLGGDWPVIRERLFEDNNLNMLVHVRPEDKIRFYERLLQNPLDKEVVVLRPGGLYPVHKEFLVEYAPKAFGKRAHSLEERNFWSIRETQVNRETLQCKDLQSFLKRCQFQGKLVIVDIGVDRRLMGLVSDLMNRMRRDGDETEDGAIMVLFHWPRHSLKENRGLRKTFREGLSERTRIEGDFFTCASRLSQHEMPSFGFTSWAHFDRGCSLQHVFDRNFRELVQDVIDLEDEAHEFQIKQQSRVSDSHFEAHPESPESHTEGVPSDPPGDSEVKQGRLTRRTQHLRNELGVLFSRRSAAYRVLRSPGPAPGSARA